MHVKQAGYIIIAIGLLSLTFSAGAVISGLDSGVVHASQLLLVGIGMVVSLIGVVLIVADRSVRFNLNKLKQMFSGFVSDLPVDYLIIAGFLVTYFLFFIFSFADVEIIDFSAIQEMTRFLTISPSLLPIPSKFFIIL